MFEIYLVQNEQSTLVYEAEWWGMIVEYMNDRIQECLMANPGANIIRTPESNFPPKWKEKEACITYQFPTCSYVLQLKK